MEKRPATLAKDIAFTSSSAARPPLTFIASIISAVSALKLATEHRAAAVHPRMTVLSS
jgi:hypothetical protein